MTKWAWTAQTRFTFLFDDMKPLVFATGNVHKVSEMNDIIGQYLPVVSMAEIGCDEDLPETQDTLEGNAIQKAEYLYDLYGQPNCFSEDTGLEIDALGGEPGVLTARYAGDQKNPADNIQKVLDNLNDKTDRSARFRTVICLLFEGRQYLFEGVCEGRIALSPSGEGGFGYDPIFIPQGYDRTFAELDKSIKNSISHRGRALEKMKAFFAEKG